MVISNPQFHTRILLISYATETTVEILFGNRCLGLAPANAPLLLLSVNKLISKADRKGKLKQHLVESMA